MSASPAKESFFTDMQQARELVDAKAARAETRLVKPAREAFLQAANDYPLSTLFGSTLFILSLFPVLSFLGFCVFTGAIITAASLAFFAFWSAVILGSAALVLAGCLVVAFSISFMVAATAAGSLVACRLYANIRSTGSLRYGFRNSITEIKQYISGSTAGRSVNGWDKPATLPASRNGETSTSSSKIMKQEF